MAKKKTPRKNSSGQLRTVDKIKLNDEVFLAAMALDTGGVSHRATVSLINFTDDTFEMTSDSWEGFRTFSTRNMKYLGKRQWLLCDPWMNLFNSPRPDSEEYKQIRPKVGDKVFDVCRAVRTGRIEVLTEITELTDDGSIGLQQGTTVGRVAELLESKMLQYLANDVWLLDLGYTAEQWAEKNNGIEEQRKVVKGLNDQVWANNAEIRRLNKLLPKPAPTPRKLALNDRVVFLSDVFEGRMTFQDALLRVDKADADEYAFSLRKETPRGGQFHTHFVPELFNYQFVEGYDAWIVFGRKDAEEMKYEADTELVAVPPVVSSPQPGDRVVLEKASVNHANRVWRVTKPAYPGEKPGLIKIRREVPNTDDDGVAYAYTVAYVAPERFVRDETKSGHQWVIEEAIETAGTIGIGAELNEPPQPLTPKPDDVVFYMAASVHSPTFGTKWKVEREGLTPGTFAIVSPAGERKVIDGDHLQYQPQSKTWVFRFADQIPVKTLTGEMTVLKKGTEVIYITGNMGDSNYRRSAVVENMHVGDVIEFRWIAGEDSTLFYVNRRQVRYSRDGGYWFIDADMPDGKPIEPKPELKFGIVTIRITNNFNDSDYGLKAVVHRVGSETVQLCWLEGPKKDARFSVARQQVQYHARTGLWFLEDAEDVKAEKAPETAPQAIPEVIPTRLAGAEKAIVELEMRVLRLENGTN